MTKTELMLALWEEGRTRLTNLLPGINSADLLRRLHPQSNSLGWLLRHIGEVEHLFAKNVFGEPIEVRASTIGPMAKDHGQFIDLNALFVHLEDAHRVLRTALEKQTDVDWEAYIETREFGRKTKAEALARISTHTAWHAGQMVLILKYGTMAD
ncbi:MAG: DinB family protein [Saprospiraceae bacterium]|nr:DinB family protein [Saprospiraceae bacterium]